MNETYLVKEPEEFDEIIETILEKYHQSDQLVLALKGDLGAGKTTFVKRLADYISVSEVVNSPTFNILKVYPINFKTYQKLVHIDAYRLEEVNEVVPINLEEEINQDNCLVCIEWPENIKHILPKEIITIDITIKEAETRLVTVTGF